MEALDLISGLTGSSATGIYLGGKSKSSGTGFDALLAALTSQSDQTLLQTAAQASGTTSSATTTKQDYQLSSPADTPIAQLETSLRQSGQPLKKITVPTESREKLVEVLENSGYSTEDAQEILRRATDDEGNINLGAMFDLLPKYTADQGPVLTLDQDGKLQLMQALKDLGVPAEEIRRFFESAEHVGDTIQLKGISELLAMANPGRTEVDRSVLEDLLGKLGLNSQEVNNLLDSTVDSQGRISPSDMLSILENAAEKNDTRIATALKTLANQIEVQGDDTKEVVRQLRTMVTQALEQTPQKNAEAAQTLQQTAQPQTMQAEAEQTQSQTASNTNSETTNNASTGSNAGTATGASEAASAEGQAETAKTAADILGKVAQQVTGESKLGENASNTGNQGRGTGNQTSDQGLAQQAAAASKAVTVGTNTQDASDSKFNDILSTAQSTAARSAGGAASGSVNKGIPAYVTRQVSQQIASMVRSGAPNLTLNLKPANLGSLNMEITMQGGKLQATLTADNIAAKHTLESGLDMLREQLTQQGIKVDRIEVAVNTDTQQQQQMAETGSQGGNGRSGRGGANEQSDQSADDQLVEEEILAQTAAQSRISVIA